MRILTWNLFHGRAVPARWRNLEDEFAATLSGWGWDVALLQEVPPWWPAALGRACHASARMALTSRNWLPPLRWLARIAPDLVKSWGGGSNAILVRRSAVLEHRVATLRHLPERRVVHAVRLGDGVWIGNVHAQVLPKMASRADTARAGATVLAWAGDAPRVVLGGDFNLENPQVPGLTRLGGRGVDHVLGRGFARVGQESPDRHGLSDHAPVIVEVA